MATKPKKYCAAYPCPNLVPAGETYCHLHKPEQASKETVPFYSTSQWQKLRRWYRKRHPFCELCLIDGLTVPAELVDHIVEIKDGGSKTDPENLQSLCRRCHAIKTSKERRKRGVKVYTY
ncbi:MAG: HNH endonuclease [Deltaproteobacteria bacterium]|nr:MAG: HNH endonuclease [Deltaproteobacteria bacterium]